jgi:hypothetical protein
MTESERREGRRGHEIHHDQWERNWRGDLSIKPFETLLFHFDLGRYKKQIYIVYSEVKFQRKGLDIRHNSLTGSHGGGERIKSISFKWKENCITLHGTRRWHVEAYYPMVNRYENKVKRHPLTSRSKTNQKSIL